MTDFARLDYHTWDRFPGRRLRLTRKRASSCRTMVASATLVMRDGLHGPACYADDAQAYFGVTHGCVAFPIGRSVMGNQPFGPTLSKFASVTLAVPPITIAASGATISNLLIPTHPEYALTIWIASYIMNGIGCLLAAFVLVLYFQRLSLHHIPGREVVVTIFLPLGPCGQGGYALLQLVRDEGRVYYHRGANCPILL